MFKKEDEERAIEFSKLIIAHANWNVDTKTLMRVYQHLVWYNSVPQNIKNSVFEVATPPKPLEKPKTKKKV